MMAEESRLGGYAATETVRPLQPRLPFKESIGSANEKLDRLLGKIENFSSHLFPQPAPSLLNSPAACGLNDFAEMLDQTHRLIELCEASLDRIRDRF